MKTVPLETLRRQALATGAELDVGGSRFNQSRTKIDLQPPARPTTPAQPAPPPEPGMTRAEVATLLAERDAVWTQQIDHITQAFGAALKSLQQPAQKAGPAGRVVRFRVTYDDDKCITDVVPVYAN